MKPILKLLVAMLLLVALAGCGDDPSTPTLIAPTATSATTVIDPTATQAQPDAAAPTATQAAPLAVEPTATTAQSVGVAPTATATAAAPTDATQVAAPPANTVEIVSDIPEPVAVGDAAGAGIADTTGYYRLQTVFSETEGRCLEGNEPLPGAIVQGAAFMDNCQNVTGQLWKLVPGDTPGYYKLQTKYLEAANRCLEGNQFTEDALFNGAAFMDECQPVTGQQWKFVAAGDSTYRLQTEFQEEANKCLEGNRPADLAVLGGAAFMDDCQEVTGQVWKLMPVAAKEADSAQTVEVVTLQYSPPYIVEDTGVYYRLQTALGEEALCLEGNRLADDAVLGGAAFMDACSDASGQMWNLIPTEFWGYYYLQTQFLAEQFKCLEGNQLSPDAILNGGAYMNDCDNEPGQLWRLVADGENSYRLQTQLLESQDKCLEGNRLAAESVLGGAAFMDTCQNATGQLWQLIPVEGSQTNNTDDGGLVPIPSGETTAPAAATTESLFDPNVSYTISTPLYEGLCLGMRSADPDRTSTTMLECAASPDQYWHVTPAATAGYYNLSTVSRGPEMRLDTANTTYLSLQPASDSSGQSWSIQPDPANPGSYLLSTIESGPDMCMAIDGSDENGGAEFMQPCGMPWKFTPVP